jgi:endonuclease III
MDDDIFKGVGIEVSLKDPENFLKIKETLTRIGIASKKEKKLYQSCHILHKRGRYVILHFKELFSLDGKDSNMTEDDVIRRDSIAILLEEWGLLKIEEDTEVENADLKQIKIVPYKEKNEWTLESKYSIGRKNR